MAKDLQYFADQHVHATTKEAILLPCRPRNFSNQKWFQVADLACKDFNMASVFAVQDLELPQHVWVADEATVSFVLAVSHTAMPEMLQAAKMMDSTSGVSRF